MNNVKKLNSIMFLFLSFIFINLISDINVYAEVNANVCYGGYLYNLYSETASNNNINYETLINGLGTQTAQLTNARNGKIFTYDSPYGKFMISYIGGVGFSNILPKCYTVTSSNTITTTEKDDPNYYYSSTTTSKYHTKACGSKYRNISFQFRTNGETETNIVNTDSGKISLIINLSGDNLSNIINRLKVYVSYDGVHGNNSAKGQCYVDAANKVVRCNNISPYKATHYNNGTKTVVNSAVYEVHFSITGTNETDFDEIGDKTSYINSCGNEIYLGSVSTTIMSETQINVNNPALNGRNQTLTNLCASLRNISNASDTLKKAYVYECYNSTIPYTELSSLETNIKDKVNLLKGVYGGISGTSNWLANVAKNQKLVCTDHRFGVPYKDIDGNIDSDSQRFESKIVYENIGTYWGMVCVEDYYVDGGSPSLIKPGMGVDYSNKVGIKKTCTIFKVKDAQRPEQCINYSTSRVYGYHNINGVETYGDAAAGPNEQFDSCIKKCDNGKYTQNCINSCYKKTYSNERSELLTSEVREAYDFSKKLNVVKVKKVPNASGRDEINLNENTYFSDGSKVEVEVTKKPTTYFNELMGQEIAIPKGAVMYRYYDSNGNLNNQIHASATCDTMDGKGGIGRVYVETVSYSGPPGCSDNPDGEYRSALAASKAELDKLKVLAETKSQIEKYSMNLVDSKTGYIYQVTGNSKNTPIDGPQLVITDISPTNYKSQSKTTTQYGSEGDTIEYPQSTTLTTIYKIELPKAYIKKDDAYVVAVGNDYTSKYYGYVDTINNNDITYYKFDPFNSSYRDKRINFKQELFTNGQNVYYTNLDSPNYNVIINSGKTPEQLFNNNVPYAVVSINDETIIYELANNIDNIFVTLKVGGVDGFISFDKTGFYCYYGVYLSDSTPPPPTVEYKLDLSVETSVSATGSSGGNTNDIKIDSSGGNDKKPTLGSIKKLNGLRYYYREIKLDDVFPNDRNPRWNWTGTITSDGNITGAASDYNGYIVDPVKLVEDIEKKGESIYLNNDEIDYEFVMTPAIINNIRNYNKTKINGRKITYLDYSLAGSTLDKRNYSERIKEWYQGTNLHATALNITDCNNAKYGGSSSVCENYGITGGGNR